MIINWSSIILNMIYKYVITIVDMIIWLLLSLQKRHHNSTFTCSASNIADRSRRYLTIMINVRKLMLSEEIQKDENFRINLSLAIMVRSFCVNFSRKHHWNWENAIMMAAVKVCEHSSYRPVRPVRPHHNIPEAWSVSQHHHHHHYSLWSIILNINNKIIDQPGIW